MVSLALTVRFNGSFLVTREHHFHDFPYFYKFQPDYLQRLQDFAGDAIAEEPPL